MTKKVVIVGAGGYTGAELVSILLRHGGVEIVGVYNSGRGAGAAPFSTIFPRFRGLFEMEVRAADAVEIAADRPDAVLLATPHEASVTLAAGLVERGMPVIDLSGAYRLKDAALYPEFYGFEHPRPDLLRETVYGLPELNRAHMARAAIVAVPGCYPTSAILPLWPLVRAGAVRAGTRVIVDSISGVSGAGRAATERTHFCEVSVRPYGVLSHRHGPEIREHSGADVVFTPHIGPYERGILSTIHVELAEGWNEARVAETLGAAHGNERFVRLLPKGSWPAVGDVAQTNLCDIAWAADERRAHLVIASALDNLVKGAAGQAVQCMNLRLGLDEGDGLWPKGGRA